MNILALDLEMCQPSGTIIQVGAAIGSLKTGKVIDTFSRIVNPHEVVSPFITELTGITQEQANNGTSLIGAYKELVEWKTKHKARKQIVTWGNGDHYVLKKQLGLHVDSEGWALGHRFYDTKTLFQAIMTAKNKKTKMGLAGALAYYGIQFEGRAHDAKFDAANTFALFYKIIKQLEKLP